MFLALALMIAVSAPALAAENPGEILGGTGLPPGGNASYEATLPEASTGVDVTFIMEAPNEYNSVEGAFYYESQVSLRSDTATNFTVSDLLDQVQTRNTDFTFTTRVPQGSEYVVEPFTAASSYLYGVEHNGVSFAPDPEYFDLWGWEFRVNNLFPVQYNETQGGYQGTAVNETYLSDGDVVHFFVNYPVTLYGVDLATDFIRLVPTVDETGIRVQVQGQENLLVPVPFPEGGQQVLQMQVSSFTAFTGAEVTVQLCTASGDVISSGTTDAAGQVVFDTVSPGTYLLRSDSALLPVDVDEEWGDCLFTRTSGYQVFTVG